METKLIIFVKAPRTGSVKTRIAKSMGDDAACSAYKMLVVRLIENLRLLRQVELRFFPDDAAGEIAPWLQKGWELRPQGDGDLGEKLKRAFLENFESGASRVLIIGSDCPAINADDIERAGAALATCDVVLGPATDGGYWLIGLRQPHPRLFENIPWSTETVLESTLSLARENGLSCHLLRELNDVDLPEDWEKYLREENPGNGKVRKNL
ncbi:MAG: TIGR04282 family arsenosugar biosynthesis glycosyltransferase [Verrucomicrobiota bacterium]